MRQIVLLIVCLLFVAGMALVGRAEVNISIGVPPPPPLVFPAPPDVVVVSSEASDVYLVPNTAGLYFFGGFWYRFHGNHWFRSTIYNGPWAYIETPRIPRAVVVIPPDYILGVPPGYHRIHYGDFHSHWRDWGRNHHWNRQPWYREHARHHWGGREFHRSTEAHHTEIHYKGSTDKGGKDTRSKAGTGTKTGTGTKVVTGTNTGTGTGTKVVTRTKTGTGTKVGTAKTSGGGGHSAGKTGGTGSKATHSEKQ